MEITGEFQIPAGREQVWDALNDPVVLTRCIPGCQAIEKISEIELNARVGVTIGPVKLKFTTLLFLENLNPPISYTLSGEAKAGPSGFGRGAADVVLTENEAGTLLSYAAGFNVGGKLAQIGSRLVLGATRKIADQFFSALCLELDPENRNKDCAADQTPPAVKS